MGIACASILKFARSVLFNMDNEETNQVKKELFGKSTLSDQHPGVFADLYNGMVTIQGLWKVYL